MEQNTLLTYVSSEGVNPFTGEIYPDASPRERTVAQIYNLLEQGYVVEDRSEGRRIPLERTSFFLANTNEILGGITVGKKYHVEKVVNTTTVNTEDKNKVNGNGGK